MSLGQSLRERQGTEKSSCSIAYNGNAWNFLRKSDALERFLDEFRQLKRMQDLNAWLPILQTCPLLLEVSAPCLVIVCAHVSHLHTASQRAPAKPIIARHGWGNEISPKMVSLQHPLLMCFCSPCAPHRKSGGVTLFPNVVPLFLCGRQESELPPVMQAAKVRKTAGQACSVHMCRDRAAAAQQLLWR